MRKIVLGSALAFEVYIFVLRIVRSIQIRLKESKMEFNFLLEIKKLSISFPIRNKLFVFGFYTKK